MPPNVNVGGTLIYRRREPLLIRSLTLCRFAVCKKVWSMHTRGIVLYWMRLYHSAQTWGKFPSLNNPLWRLRNFPHQSTKWVGANARGDLDDGRLWSEGSKPTVTWSSGLFLRSFPSFGWLLGEWMRWENLYLWWKLPKQFLQCKSASEPGGEEQWSAVVADIARNW